MSLLDFIPIPLRHRKPQEVKDQERAEIENQEEQKRLDAVIQKLLGQDHVVSNGD